jgi:hypothetical protein
MGWSRGNEGKRAVLWVVFFVIWIWDAAVSLMGVRRQFPTLSPKDTTFLHGTRNAGRGSKTFLSR